MSQICSACGRGALTGNLRSKSMVAKKTRQKVNLQSRRIDQKKIKICTSCIKLQNNSPKKFTLQISPKRLTKRRSKRSA